MTFPRPVRWGGMMDDPDDPPPSPEDEEPAPETRHVEEEGDPLGADFA